MHALLVAMRPGQWIKNLLLFAGLVFAGRLFDLADAALAVQAFIVFCLFSSSVYLVNDFFDRETDRLHPLKKNRPLASGGLAAGTCLRTAAVLAFAGLVWSVFLGWGFLAVGAGYLSVSLLYSWRLKRVVIIDVMLIALGFVLRVAGGTVAIAVETSHWILLCTFLLSLFLAFAKRRHELVLLEDGADSHRPVLSHYSPYFLDQMISIVTASTLICYVLYTLSPETAEHVGSRNLIFSVPFVMYGIFRYLYLIHRKQGGGDPTLLLLTDRSLLAAVAAWLAVSLSILYL